MTILIELKMSHLKGVVFLVIATAKGVEMMLLVETLAERGFPQHNLLGNGYIYSLDIAWKSV